MEAPLNMAYWLVSCFSSASIAVLFLIPAPARQTLCEEKPHLVMSLWCSGLAGFLWIALTRSLMLGA